MSFLPVGMAGFVEPTVADIDSPLNSELDDFKASDLQEETPLEEEADSRQRGEELDRLMQRVR